MFLPTWKPLIIKLQFFRSLFTGNEMRIDLLADTANSPHQGFQLRYKQTSMKDRAGFQSKLELQYFVIVFQLLFSSF